MSARRSWLASSFAVLLAGCIVTQDLGDFDGGLDASGLDASGLDAGERGDGAHGDGSIDGGSIAEVPLLALGPHHGCAWNLADRLVCWGWDSRGQVAPELGVWSSGHCPECVLDPVRTQALVPAHTDGLAAGALHTCALVDGEVSCWGAADLGQLGTLPRDEAVRRAARIDSLTDIRAVVAGRHHSCALDASGEVRCWGLGAGGRLGRDPATLPLCNTLSEQTRADLGAPAGTGLPCSADPQPVPGIRGAQTLVAGPDATCAILADGSVWCWGVGSHGELGNGTLAGGHIPTRWGLDDVRTLAIGARHACAIDSRDRVFCSGAHDRGQLGIAVAALGSSPCDTGLCWPDPIEVPGVRARDVAAGDAHTCVLDLDGETIRCTGSDARDALGREGDVTEDCGGVPCARTFAPTHMARETSGLVRLHASGERTCALSDAPVATDDAGVRLVAPVLCWGANERDQSGLGAQTADSIGFPEHAYAVAYCCGS